MKKFLYIIVGCVYFIGMFTMPIDSLNAQEVISLSSDLWCPYACDEKSPLQGFMIDIAKEIFESEGYKIKYTTINWARALAETREGKFSAIVGASRGDVPGFVLPDEALGVNTNYFWIKKNESWVYKNLDSLKGKKIGVINSYAYADEIDLSVQKKNPSFVVISGNEALTKIIKMAEANRLDGFIENPIVLNYFLKDFPEYKNHFKIASSNVSADKDLFIAFSPKNPYSKKYATILSSGMLKIRKNGKLKKILSQYGLLDWK